MTALELKPCPFCGLQAEAYKGNEDMRAHCPDQDCAGYWTLDCPPEKWNRRAALSAPAWTPPPEGERPYNYECLGWIYGGWDFVFWVDDHWQTRRGNRCHPADFRPMPQSPFAPLPEVRND